MKKILFFAALFTATVFNLSATDMDTLYLNTGGSTLWNQAGAKFSVFYWNDNAAENFTDFLELAYGETDIYRAIIPKSDSVIFVRHAATADVPTWENKLHQTKSDEVDLEIGNIMVITGWEPADREWDYYTPKQAPKPDMHDFLYFVSLKANGTVRLNKGVETSGNLANLTATFEYSKDRINWTDYTWPDNSGKGGYAITLTNAGDTVFFRAKGVNGKNAKVGNFINEYYKFTFGADDQIAAGGNVMSLYDATCEQDTMTAYGFCDLFSGASQLVSAPKLPATKMAAYCYNCMFKECTSLTQAPELKATTLAEKCYRCMFDGCTALTQAPALPADSLALSCYNSMFDGCTALTAAPALPATVLEEDCYNGMFYECTALTQAPELKATTLAQDCYENMFYGCTSLQVDTCTGSCDGAELVVPDTTDAPINYWAQNMFYGCKGAYASNIQLGGHYCVKEYVAPDMHDFLYLVSLKANGTVRLNKYGGNDLAYLTATFEYSKDRINWTEYTWGGTDNKKGAAITLTNAGDTVFFRAKGTKGKNATMSYNDVTYFNFAFNSTDSIAAGGNVMSLYDATCEQDTMTAYGFSSLFRDCAKKLVSVSDLKLPVTKLAEGCYRGMFYNCLKITNVPALPVTTLAPSCYVFMFYKCTSLTVAPELPATTLADNCYSNMFSNCTALTQAPELNATVLAPKCYNLMFASCSSLTSAPELKATTLADSCYKQMFIGCSKLEVSTFAGSCDGAELVVPDTTAAPINWNMNMFDGCHVNDSVKLGGHYCVKEYKEPVCKIGTKGYSSIAAAVAAVQAGDTIQVIKDIQLDAMINVSSSTPAFTLDLNGHILDGGNLTGNNTSLINNAGTLSIIDSDPTATHEAPFDTIAGAIMTGGKGYKDVNNTYGGAIYSKNGTLNVNGVAFVTNSAFRGGAVWLNGSNSTFTNCRFYGNTDTDSGAAVGINNNSQCSIDSCVIKGNSTKTGTIYAYECSLTIAHTTITDNTSSIYCGAMYVLKTSLTLGDGTVVTNNTSADTTVPSGGIYVWTEDIYKNSITLSGKVIIKDNTSNGQPANLCLSGKTACDTVTLNGLSEGSEIYVCTMINDVVAPATFATNATETDLQYFVSDNGYAFVLDKNGKIVSKEAYGRKVTSGNYGTICLDKQFIAMEGVEALYVPSYKDASKLYCSEVKLSDAVAGGAYIFKANADSVTFAFEGEAVAAAINNDHMIGWLAADSVLAEAPAYYLLSNNQIIKPEAGSTILKNRAFIDLANVSTNPPSAAGRYIALGINEATGLENAEFKIQNAECKMLVNGQLIIIRDGVKYNAMGQKME